jgi:hypothetical protein
MPAITLSIDSGASFSTESVINISDDAQNNAVSGDGSLAAVIDVATGNLWLNSWAAPYEPVYCLDVTPFTTPGKTPQAGGPADAPH